MKHYDITDNGKKMVEKFQTTNSFIQEYHSSLKVTNPVDVWDEELHKKIKVLKYLIEHGESELRDIIPLIDETNGHYIEHLVDWGMIEDTRPDYQITNYGEGRIRDIQDALNNAYDIFGIEIDHDMVIQSGTAESSDQNLMWVMENLNTHDVWSYDSLEQTLSEDVEDFMEPLIDYGYAEKI
jgi:predicted transcriptional regulator